MREDYDRCRDAGMDDFVAKPVTLAALATPSSAPCGQPRRPTSRAAGPRRPDAPGRSSSTTVDDRIDRCARRTAGGLGGAAALARIVQLFLEQLDPQAAQIARPPKHATTRAGGIGHRMKSSSATLGATTLADVLEQIEAAAIDATPPPARSCARVATAVSNASAAFERVIEGLDAAELSESAARSLNSSCSHSVTRSTCQPAFTGFRKYGGSRLCIRCRTRSP